MVLLCPWGRESGICVGIADLLGLLGRSILGRILTIRSRRPPRFHILGPSVVHEILAFLGQRFLRQNS